MCIAYVYGTAVEEGVYRICLRCSRRAKRVPCMSTVRWQNKGCTVHVYGTASDERDSCLDYEGTGQMYRIVLGYVRTGGAVFISGVRHTGEVGQTVHIRGITPGVPQMSYSRG